MTHQQLLVIAKDLVGERRLSSLASAGYVACALLTANGNVYTGICLDAQVGMVFCAERAAIVAMVTAGESHILKLVATGVNDEGACAPCGICREFINAVHDENYKCEVLLNDGTITTIEQLLPWRLGTH
ncbi:MAG: cytidine deaminase [Oscillospiraceae bacterium]|nr:cytidine deaminase [Oscillospiraceae bacterium]